MITEDEAKTKWCPMARAEDLNLGGTANRPDQSYGCIASDCMAWRWAGYGAVPSNTVPDQTMLIRLTHTISETH